jgi:vacuolar-type H+-ATPase subunit H
MDTRELWGRKFKIVKNGLDEAEVFSFIGGLIDQNNALASKLEHLDSLTKLAERTVIEANKQAQITKKEAEEQANARTASIIADAEEKARRELERITLEYEQKAQQTLQEKIAAAEQQVQFILKEAEEKVESIKTNANYEANKFIAEAKQSAESIEQRAQEMLKAAEEKAESIKTSATDEADRLVAEAKKNVLVTEQQVQEMLKGAEEKAESIKANAEKKANRHVAEAKEKAEDLANARVTSAEKEAQSILEASRAKAEEESHLIKQKSEQMLKRSRKIAEGEIKEKLKRVYQGLLSSLEEINDTTIVSLTEEHKESELVKPEPITHVKAEKKTKESPKLPPPPKEKVEMKESPATIYEGDVELVIPPPLGLDKMLQLHKHLRNIPNIEVLNLGVSSDKSITIRVSLENPTPLRKILEDLPEVETTADVPEDLDTTSPTKKTGERAAVKRIIVSTKK